MTKKNLPYQQKIPSTWWLANRRYLYYMVREFSGPALAVYSVITLYGLYLEKTSIFRLAQAPWYTPLMSVMLVFAVLHTITWFVAFSTTKLRMSTRVLPRKILFAGLIILWLLASVVLGLFFYR